MAASRIEQIHLWDFRSYEDAATSFGDTTFLVGRNAAGKSSLLDALKLVSELTTDQVTRALDDRGGYSMVRRRKAGRGAPPDIALWVSATTATISGSYEVRIRAATNRTFKVSGERLNLHTEDEQYEILRQGASIVHGISGVKMSLADDSLLLPVLRGIRPFDSFVNALFGIRVYAIEPLRMKEAQKSDDGIRLRSDGSNSASVVREMRKSSDSWRDLLKFLRAAVPQIQDIEVKHEGEKLSLQFRQFAANGGTMLVPGFQSSDGTLRILGILLALLRQPPATLVALEEPEAHVHPGALGVILDAIQYASHTMQVVVTTQSPDLLNAKWITANDVRVIEWQDGVSDISMLSAGTEEVLRRHLSTPGELLRSDALDAASVVNR